MVNAHFRIACARVENSSIPVLSYITYVHALETRTRCSGDRQAPHEPVVRI